MPEPQWRHLAGPEDSLATRTAGHSGQRPKRKQKLRGKNTHPTKANSKIGAKTYNYPKPRNLEASIKTQSTTAREICRHQSLDILLQQALNISS